MMPLWTMLTRGVEWGWLLTSLGSPWVAQRVCPMPQKLSGRFLLQLAAEHFQPALALDDVDAAFQRQRNAGGVIAAVFQLFQTVQQHFLGAALTRITYDATHTKHLHADSPARTYTAAVSLL